MKNRILPSLCGLLYLALLSAAPAAAFSESTDGVPAGESSAPACTSGTSVVLSGHTTDNSGAAVPNAQIVVQCGSTTRQTTTDGSGNYTLRLPSGNYRLRSAATGFAPAERDVTLAAGGSTADLTLSIAAAGDTVTVTADEDYTALASTAGTKTATPLIDLPQAISVITLDQLRARDTQTISDTLRYTAGVDAEPYGTDSRVDWFFIRGFGMTFDGLFLDGLALPKITGADASYTANPFSLQQVNVIKGPASVLYGQNEPGGLVELVSKRPPTEGMHELRFEGGAFDRFQGIADFGGPVGASTHWFYRVNGVARDSRSQVQFVKDNLDTISPALTWKPDDRTNLTILTSYLDLRTGSLGGFLPAQGMTLAGGKIAPNPNGNIPAKFFDSEPAYDNFHKREYFSGYQFERRLSDHYTVRQNFRWLHLGLPQYIGLYGTGFVAPAGEESYCAANPNAAICTRILSRSAINGNQNNTQYAVDNQFQANLRAGRWGHTFLAGYNYQHQGSGVRLGYGPSDAFGTPGDPNNGPNIDIFTPLYGSRVPVPGFVSTNTRGALGQHGIYLQDQISYARLSIILSGREDWALEHVRNLNAATQPSACPAPEDEACVDQNASKFTGRAGVLYHATNGFAPYFSYATSFNPVLGLNTTLGNNNQVISVKPFLPDTGAQYEVGAKYQPHGLNALFTAALFQITQNNVQTTDPTNPLNTVQAAEQRSRGVELEGQASLSHNLNLVGSFTHEQVLYTKPYFGVVNTRPVTVPANLASLWIDYNPRTRFGAGAGLRFKGVNPGAADNSFFIPGHTLLDAEFHYTLSDRVRLGFNGQNLLDKTYVAYCYGSGSCNYGFRRTMNGNLTYRFASLLQPWKRD